MSESDKAQETYSLYRYDRENGHDSYLRRAEVAQRYYASRQWSDEDAKRRASEERPTVTVNEIFEVVNSIAGELEQLSTDVVYQSSTGDAETADMLNILSQHVDRTNKMYIHDDRVRRDGLLTGRGFYEMRVEFDDNLQGHVVARSRRPQNVVLPAEMDSMDPTTWSRVSTIDVLSLQDVEHMFGKALANDMKGMPLPEWYDIEDRTLSQSLGYNSTYRTADYINDSDNPYIRQYRMVSMQYEELKYKEFFVDVDTGDMAEIPENWSNEKIKYAIDRLGLGTMRKKAKTLRWRVVVNDRVVHDEDSPYKYYTIVPYFPFFLDGATLSLFDILKGPQDLLNKSLSEEIHIMTSTAASGWKIKNGSLKNMTPRDLEQKGAKNGLVLALDDVADAEKITTSAPPAGFQTLSTRAQDWVKQLAGLTPSMQGAQRADAAGEGIRMQLLRAPVNLAVPLTSFHFTKHLMAERKLNLFQTFYTETRVMHVAVGSYGRTEQIAINNPVGDRIVHDLTLGSYNVQVIPSASRLQAEEYAFDELVQLKELGVQVPNDLLIENSSINAKAGTAARLREANNGDLSPEEQMARQLELEMMQLEAADKQAGIENKNALTQLSNARAQRAVADAQTPQARIMLDAARLRSENARNREQLAQSREKQVTDTAIKLTELEVDRQQAKEDAKAKAKKPSGAGKKSSAKKQPRK